MASAARDGDDVSLTPPASLGPDSSQGREQEAHVESPRAAAAIAVGAAPLRSTRTTEAPRTAADELADFLRDDLELLVGGLAGGATFVGARGQGPQDKG